MARGVKGTGMYSRAKYTGNIHWSFWVLWVIVFVIACCLAIGGK